jgi:hypothetical protein
MWDEFLNFVRTYWFEITTLIVLLGGTAIFYFYSEEAMRDKIKKFIPIITLTCIWVVVRKLWENNLVNWKVPDILFLSFTFLSLILRFFMYKEQYLTHGHVIADGCPDACFSTPSREVGDYTIFNCGSSNHTFMYEEGDFILVVPTKSISWYWPKAVCDVQVTQRDLYELPQEVVKYILPRKNLNQNLIYFGKFNKDFFNCKRKIKVNGREATLKNAEEEFCLMNQKINLYQEAADGRSTTLEKTAGSFKRLDKAMKRKPQFREKSRKLNDDEYGENQ